MIRVVSNSGLAILVAVLAVRVVQAQTPEAPAAPAAPATASSPPAVPPALAPYPAGEVDATPPEAALAWSAPSGAPRVEVWLGAGNTWVANDSFDAFADDDALVGVSAGAALRLGSTEGSGIRLVALWDLASRSADYRGEDTSLGAMRFGFGPELALPLLGRLDLHLRAAASALMLDAELEESSSGATLSDDAWSFGAEGAVGITFRFADLSAQRSPLSFLLRAEAGYGWVASHELSLEADDGPRRSESLPLGDLSLAGPLVRVGVGAGF
jgi:hypothetical protein